MSDYHQLIVWKRALELATLTYRLAHHFPKDELYALTSQLKRAVVSVMANIVEGSAKPTKKDFLKFLYTASGSLSECQCYYELALELEYINKEQFDYIEEKRKEVGYLLSRLLLT